MTLLKVASKCQIYQVSIELLRRNRFSDIQAPPNRAKWKLFVESSLTGHTINLLLQGNLNSDDVDSLGIEEPLTKELIETWSLVNFKKHFSNFGETPIWYNSVIRIDNKPIHYCNWSSAGVYFVRDLLGEDSQFLPFNTFKEKFAINIKRKK